MTALSAATARLRVAACCLLIAPILASCAQDLGLIDRVQPGAIHKSVFAGHWYFQRTVVDAPFTVGWTFVGEAEETDRIHWKIEQDKLIAYRVYDFIQGTDLAYKDAAKPGENVTGQPVAIYPIVKHLDVMREYAPSTGEQTNVLVENDEDLPWYQRDYVRVDWAKNEGVNFNFPVDSVAMKPVDHVILDPSDPDAFTMGWRSSEATNGTGWSESRDPVRHRETKSADYIDFVTKVHATPEVIDEWDPWWGPMSWPLCWFYFNEDCKAAEIKIRTSIMKVPADETYRPLKYPDNYILRDDKGAPIRAVEVAEVKTTKDGDFDLDNLDGKGVARVTKTDIEAAKKAGKPAPDANVVRIPMFDKFGYFRTERYGYDDKYGEVESARPLHIARHDIWEKHVDDAGKPIPYDKRTPKPIVYWLGQGFDPQLVETAKAAGKAWDRTFREVVAAAQGKKAADLAPMVVVKENTLAFDADGKVTDRGQRVGDIRYSLLSLVNEPTRAGLLGYGPTAMDPLSGKILSGHAHIYAGPLKVFATNGRDILRLARGELDPVDYGLGHVSSAEVTQRLKRFAPTPKTDAKQAKAKAAKQHADHQKRVKEARDFAKRFATKQRRNSVKSIKDKLKVQPGWSHKKAQRLRGSKLEDRLITKDMTLLFGSAKDKQAMMSAAGPRALSKGQKARVSPANWASRAGRRMLRERHKMLAKRNIYHAAFAQDAVLGLAETLKDVKDPEKVWQAIYRDVFKSTALHELGHTLGLRHNFEASSDALNYHDYYWKMRGPNGSAMDLPKLSDGQLKSGLLDYRYSSIMEYSSRFHHDIKGLGYYDRAAIAFGYAELVEVFGDKAAAALKKSKWFGITRNEVQFALGTMTTDAKKKDVIYTDYESGDARLLLDSLYRGALHYTHMPKMFGGTANLSDRKFVPYSQLVAERSGEASKGIGDPKARKLYEVPYRFCSDEYEMGTSTCAMYDEGADPYEMVHGAMSKYHDYYFVKAFRRDRTNFFIWDYDGQVYWNNFMPVLNQYQHWVDAVTDYSVLGGAGLFGILADYRGVELGLMKEGENVPLWEEHPLGGLGATAGIKMGLNALAQVVSTPDPGGYCYDKAKNRYYKVFTEATSPICKGDFTCHSDLADPSQDPNYASDCVNLNIPLGLGRHDETVYDGETGYYYYERLRYIGAYYDKWNALAVLTDPETMFIGQDASQALASYVISTMLWFRPQIMRFFGALISGRKDQFGWKVDASGKTPAIKKTDLFLEGNARKKHDSLPYIEMPGLYNLRPTAMWMGMAWFNADWDQSFNHATKVWVKGAVDAVDPAKSATVVSFDNPLDHHTYQALQMSNPEVYSIGIEMLKTCEKAAATWKGASQDNKYGALIDLEFAVQFLELLRGYQSLYGQLIW